MAVAKMTTIWTIFSQDLEVFTECVCVFIGFAYVLFAFKSEIITRSLSQQCCAVSFQNEDADHPGYRVKLGGCVNDAILMPSY